jgi:hypothetical protein
MTYELMWSVVVMVAIVVLTAVTDQSTFPPQNWGAWLLTVIVPGVARSLLGLLMSFRSSGQD